METLPSPNLVIVAGLPEEGTVAMFMLDDDHATVASQGRLLIETVDELHTEAGAERERVGEERAMVLVLVLYVLPFAVTVALTLPGVLPQTGVSVIVLLVPVEIVCGAVEPLYSQPLLAEPRFQV